MNDFHQSVMADKVIAHLKITQSAWYLDSTLGDGGHASLIRQAGGRVVGLDLDTQALARASKRLEVPSTFGGGDTCPLGVCWANTPNIKLFRANFSTVDQVVNSLELAGRLAGAVYDLGYSSRQYDNPGLGLSFRHPNDYLDMRLDPSLKITASQIINNYSNDELSAIFAQLGEDQSARSLADHIISARALAPINTVGALVDIIAQTNPRSRSGQIDPATQVFQALRIEVNHEIDNLRTSIVKLWPLLQSQARLAVISFHSLEDRAVKNIYKQLARQNEGKIITKKPIVPSKLELAQNPRSRSAKLRVISKN